MTNLLVSGVVLTVRRAVTFSHSEERTWLAAAGDRVWRLSDAASAAAPVRTVRRSSCTAAPWPSAPAWHRTAAMLRAHRGGFPWPNGAAVYTRKRRGSGTTIRRMVWLMAGAEGGG